MNPNRIKHLTDTEGGVCKALKYLAKTLDNVLTKDNTVLICDNTEVFVMSKKRLGQVDLDTGEVIEDGFIAYIAPKRQNAFGRWVAMAQEMMDITAKSNLGGSEYKVLMLLLSRLDYENLLVINQSELAEYVGMTRNNFSRSMKKLIDQGIILKGPRIGVSRSFRLNPTYGWKGTASNHKKAVKSHLEVIKGGKDPRKSKD